MNSAVTRGLVVVYPNREGADPCGHERATHHALAKKIAAIKGWEFAGEYDNSRTYADPLYFVPSDTVTALDAAHSLGICSEQDLFGGVVPFSFVASKTITHALPAPACVAPPGWSCGFSQRVLDVVLPGFTAFTLDDAHVAGARMLKQGTVRMKKPSGMGGLGQAVITDENELQACLQALDREEVLREGIVFECNLNEVTTHSVGQVCLGNLLATYHGTQRLTVSNRNETVYGGSDLIIVRGNFDQLLRLNLAQEMMTAIKQARTYHAAALASYSGMFASRCNYDIAQGVDDEGRWRSGVLEQSWRIGGASGAEIAALAAFHADPSLAVVRASTTEVYGADPQLPPDAEIYYQGIDKQAGPLAKYSRLSS